MKRGPKPTPPALKLAKGTRPDRVAPPTVDAPGRAEPPAYLAGEALAEWERLAPVLERMGVLSAVDAPMLALYCEAHAEYLDASARLKADGLTVPCGNSVKTSPYVAVRNTASAVMRRVLAEFGCSPSSRSGLTSAAPAAASKFEQFLAKRKG